MLPVLAMGIGTLSLHPLHAGQVVDDFESGANPNGCSWTNIDGEATITTFGGKPGMWIDTGSQYFA